ncbi:MAG: TIGR03915 family putative DNA repair protein [Flavobacteriales bacterium]|nr:TIGR03915 family putative DNA repair protein [Flavobacteriales bacterium]
MKPAWCAPDRARHYVYDGSWPGLLTVVFTVFAEKSAAASVVRDRAQVSELFSTVRAVATDEAQATRVLARARTLLGPRRVRELWCCHLAERAEVDRLLVDLFTLAFTGGAVDDPRDPTVLGLRQWRKHVRHEKHQMEAFVRFQQNTNAVWTATIAPAYDVLPLIAAHFRARYADMEWLIADQRRGYGLHHRAGTVVPVELLHDAQGMLPATPVSMAADERSYVRLWKTYFRRVDIPERRNLGLQMRHMPKRHWRYMVEMMGA